MKLDVMGIIWLHFKVADFLSLVNFDMYSQNEVGNIGILVLCGEFVKNSNNAREMYSPGRNSNTVTAAIKIVAISENNNFPTQSIFY